MGLDKIDLAAAAARGVAVGYTPDVLNDCVADTAFGLLLEAQAQRKRGQKIKEKQGMKDVLDSMKSWFAKNF